MTTAPGPVPNLFLLGAPKCATTSIASMLASHPDVTFGASKEPGIFTNRDYSAPDRSSLLSQHYRGAVGTRWLLDATPWLLYDATALQRILETTGDPDAAPPVLLVSLRDPMSRMISMYKDQRRRGRETESFTGAVARSLRELDRTDVSDLPRQYVRTSCYGSALVDWLTELDGLAPIHLAFFEAIEADPTCLNVPLRDVLGLDLDPLASENTAESTTAVGTATVDRLVGLGARLPPGVRSVVRRVAVPLASSILERMPERSHDHIDTGIEDDGLAAELEQVFAEDGRILDAALAEVRLLGPRAA